MEKFMQVFMSPDASGGSILDEVAAEVANLTDEEIAAAAAQIQARRQKEKDRMTPDRKEAMKQREKRKRALNKAILALAKEKGLVPKEAPTA